jgi:TrpR family trp operon transcriptional repressor
MSDFNELTDIIFTIKDRAVLEDFLLGLTTPKERMELVQRVEIIKRLLQNEPQAKIAKDLGVGVATVTRGSKELMQGRFKTLRKN